MKKHSYIAFYPGAWASNTVNMPRLMRSVYFDVCFHTWLSCEKASPTELEIMLSDLPAQQSAGIIDALVRTGRLERDEDGNVWSDKALREAEKAHDLYQRKAAGGRTARAHKQDSSESHGAELESDLKKESAGADSKKSTPAAAPPADPDPPRELEIIPDEDEAPTRGKPKRSLPADWSPKLTGRTAELAERLGDEDLAIEAELFRNHAESVDRKCSDWDAAFRNWLIQNEKRDRRHHRGKQSAWR